MLGYPLRVAHAPVEGRGGREGGVEIVDGAWESILKETIWIYWGRDLF